MMETNRKKINEVCFGTYKLPTASKASKIDIYTLANWYILKEDEGRALLLSKDIIDWEFYDCDTYQKCENSEHPWGKSYIREHLNNTLYNQMFTEEEKMAILPINPYRDNMFFLSLDEIPFEIRTADLFFADTINGKTVVWKEKGRYWTDTIGVVPFTMSIIWKDGSIIDDTRLESDEVGIRPAMWVNLKEAERITLGKGTRFYQSEIEGTVKTEINIEEDEDYLLVKRDVLKGLARINDYIRDLRLICDEEQIDYKRVAIMVNQLFSIFVKEDKIINLKRKLIEAGNTGTEKAGLLEMLSEYNDELFFSNQRFEDIFKSENPDWPRSDVTLADMIAKLPF